MPAKKKSGKLSSGEVNIYSLEGEVVDKLALPEPFRHDVRVDLIRKAVSASQANRRQPYGPNPGSGMRHAVSTWGKGRGVARVQRITDMRRAAQSPGTVGGRRAHPPSPEKDWKEKINRKEKRLAKLSALSATAVPEIVSKRGHKFDPNITVPVVVEDAIEKVDKTKEAEEILKALGVYDDILRSKEGRHIRAGKGKMRSRKYKKPRSVLIVFSSNDAKMEAFRNLPGIDVAVWNSLNAEVLAPGGDPGRLTIFSRSAIEATRRWTE